MSFTKEFFGSTFASTPLNCNNNNNFNCNNNNNCKKKFLPKDIESSLLLAIKQGNLNLIKRLIEYFHLNINIQNEKGETLLFLTIKNKFLHLPIKESIINYLLISGADVNLSTSEGASPLHLASGLGLFKIIKLLIEYGAFINITDKFGETPLHWAVRGNQITSLTLLMHMNANIGIKNSSNEDICGLAKRLNRIQFLVHLRELLQEIFVNNSNNNNNNNNNNNSAATNNVRQEYRAYNDMDIDADESLTGSSSTDEDDDDEYLHNKECFD